MKESSTYQAIVEEGRQEGRRQGALIEAKKLLRLVGDRRFGAPDIGIAQAIEAIDDVARLEDMAWRLADATSWQELLGPPVGGSRKRRRRQSS